MHGGVREMRLLLAVIAVLAGAVLARAAEQNFPADGGMVHFNMPSGNVGCQYTPAGGSDVYVPEDGGPEIGCDRIEPTYQRFILGKAGKAKRYDNVGDTGCCDGSNVLRYGNVWRKGPFTCRAAREGLTCERGDGHGFFVSRSGTRVW